MSSFGRAIVRYSEYEARMSQWRYLLNYNKMCYEAFRQWVRDHQAVLDPLIGLILILWFLSLANRCYRSWCAAAAAAPQPAEDKKQLRAQLAHVENAIKALKDHKNCIIEKLKCD
jgi:hypothetical protein